MREQERNETSVLGIFDIIFYTEILIFLCKKLIFILIYVYVSSWYVYMTVSIIQLSIQKAIFFT